MSAALQIQEESLANPMAPDNFHHHDIWEEKERLDGANDNALVEKSDDGNGDDPSDDPTPSAAKPVNNPVEGDTDCQATQSSQLGDDGETASDNPEVIIVEPKEQATSAPLKVRSDNVVKNLDVGRDELLGTMQQVTEKQWRQLSRIPVLLETLEHDDTELNALIEKRGMPKPADNAQTPAANICIAYYVMPDRDINSSSTRTRISEMVGVVARLRNLKLFGEDGFKFLQENGGVKGVYNDFNVDGTPKAKPTQEQEGTPDEPSGEAQSSDSGDTGKPRRHAPSGNRNQGRYGRGKEPPNSASRNTGSVDTPKKDAGAKAASESAGQEIGPEMLPIIDSTDMLGKLKSAHETASQHSSSIQQKLDHLRNRTDDKSVVRREQLEKELDAAKTASVEASQHMTIVERLQTVTIWADGELKVEQMPPSVVTKDVTTHAGFALMLVAVNDDGEFQAVANMTPDLDEFTKLIRMNFNKPARKG